jgi:membrane-bound lytic murein transglycosylase B
MSPAYRCLLAAALLGVAAPSAIHAKRTAEPHPGARSFARELARESDALDARGIERVLAGARYQQSIIDAMMRPAEKTKPWREYRPIFLTAQRIDDGVAFYREHRAQLERVARGYPVPPELIVAILGVETQYGRITGKYRVLDALVTLAFYYPPRAEFFRNELKQLLLLPDGRLPVALDQATGSYAGAMGWGQFMPTSIARYGLSDDGDERVDLWNSTPDILASIANYFVAHGWEPGAPIAHRATVAADARVIEPADLEPVFSVGQLAAWGYRVDAALDPQRPATLLELDGSDGSEYWVVYRNFWVISRYNRSPLYSMAAHQLAQAIAAGVGDDAIRIVAEPPR